MCARMECWFRWSKKRSALRRKQHAEHPDLRPVREKGDAMRRSEQRVQMAEIVVAFATAVAALGGAAAGVHEVTGGGGAGVHGGEEEEGGQGRRGAGGGEEEETGAGQSGESGGGDTSGGKPHDTGTADTQPAPPRRPEQGHPLDSTAEVRNQGAKQRTPTPPRAAGRRIPIPRRAEAKARRSKSSRFHASQTTRKSPSRRRAVRRR